MTTPADDLRRRMISAFQDGEIMRLSPGLETAVVLAVGEREFRLIFRDGHAVVDVGTKADLRLSASEEAVTYAQITAAGLSRLYSPSACKPGISFSGDPKLWAQARPVLKRLFELAAASLVPAAPAVQRDLSHISG